MIGRLRKIYAGRKRQTIALAVILSGFAIVAFVLLLLGGEEKGILGEKKPRGSIKILRGVDLAREKWRIEGEKRLGMIETEQREIREGLEAVSAALGALEQKSSESYPYPPPQDRGRSLSPKRSFLPPHPSRAWRHNRPSPRKRKARYGFSPHSGAPWPRGLRESPPFLTGFPREASSRECS